MNKQLRNKFASAFLTVAMTLTAICPATTAQAADASDSDSTEVTYTANNEGLHNLTGYWARPIKSYLVSLRDKASQEAAESSTDTATMMRVFFADGSSKYKAIVAEYLKDGFEPVGDTKVIAPELPVFGGFCEAGDYYYILTGQSNPNESNDVACFNIAKYTKAWELIKSTDVTNCNTKRPFDAGSARMAATEDGTRLVIHTCHTMHKTYDGVNHQANMTLVLNTETMNITQKITGISGTGYMSHSFNQFVKVDNDKIVAVDHGDAYPRSLRLFTGTGDLHNGSIGGVYSTPILKFAGKQGVNTTNASTGGFEISDTSYLVAGNSIDQDTGLFASKQKRNIFVAAVSREQNKDKTRDVAIKPLTSYNDSADVAPSTPHLVEISKKKYLVLWSEGSDVLYAAVDGTGTLIKDPADNSTESNNANGSDNSGDTSGSDNSGASDNSTTLPSGVYKMQNAKLSDCVPVVVSGSSIAWYTQKGTNVTYYTIDANDLSKGAESVSSNHLTQGDPIQSKDDPASTPNDAPLETPIDSDTNPSPPSSSSSSPSWSECRISFNANGGKLSGSSITYTYNGRLSYLPTATRDGYSFEGWYTSPTGGTRITDSTQFTYDYTVYAHWKQNESQEYIVTFDANGGTLIGSATQTTVQQQLTSLPKATRDGYSFQGWYTADNIHVTDAYHFHENVTLFAQWQKASASTEYTITFDANGGTVVGDSAITTINQMLPSLPNAVRDGYSFHGWYDSADGGTQILTSHVFQADSVVYAQWTPEDDPQPAVSIKRATLKSVKSPSKGKLKVSWKRDSNADGYQVAYSKNKNFAAKKTTVKNVKASKNTITFSGLSKGKIYYVRVRTYKKVDGKKQFGKWSKVQTVTIKK